MEQLLFAVKKVSSETPERAFIFNFNMTSFILAFNKVIKKQLKKFNYWDNHTTTGGWLYSVSHGHFCFNINKQFVTIYFTNDSNKYSFKIIKKTIFYNHEALNFFINLKVLHIHNNDFHWNKYNYVLKQWKNFVKAKKSNRIGLKLLYAISPHLGNPRFINFNI